MVRQALKEAGREDLIGMAPRCLIKPRGEKGGYAKTSQRGNNNSSAHGWKKSATLQTAL